MNTMKIHSSLYDYTVEFMDDFSAAVAQFDENTAFVIDQTVYKLYQARFSSIDTGRVFFMEAVEHKKNMDTVMAIITFFQKIGVRKNWHILCFGGGITQDVTTMASNLFLRNVDWYFFPTTLLAMCDSCIGGKCGINFNRLKNQLGVFYPPKKILIDPLFIKTLSEEDYLNGWGELLKFSLTSDPAFYEDIRKEPSLIPCENIQSYIERGLMVKKRIIEEDEFESDLRRVLNYGHTFGHALEAYTDNDIPHGKGVIWGIDVVNFIAMREGLITEEYYRGIKAFIRRAFLKQEIVIEDPDRLFSLIKTDKKVKGNIMNFALLDGASHLIVYPMAIDDKLRTLFADYLRTTHAYYND